MNRNRQEKDQMVRRFYEILPVMRDWDTFGWIVPRCDADPEYKVYPVDHISPRFLPFVVNFKTGWHDAVTYLDDSDKWQKIPEGITDVSDYWSDRCSEATCACKNGR